MKLRLLLSCLISLIISLSSQATTLKLAPEIELLVLDGRKISSTLLKGADGLELEHGEHQFLFRVEKKLKRDKIFTSVPLIATFSTQASAVTILLPSLQTVNQRKAFTLKPGFSIVDDKGGEIVSKRDRLFTTNVTDPEQAMLAYNRNGHIASVPRFAKPETTFSFTTPIADLQHNSSRSECLFTLWLNQIDVFTRQQMLQWGKILRTS